MKKVIKLLSILTISTPIPLTAVGCDNKNATQKVSLEIFNKKLTEEITKMTTNVVVKLDQSNQQLDKLINTVIANINLDPNLVKPLIQYYSDDQAKNNISSLLQKVGNLYVTISANINDQNYQGVTKPIKINLKQHATKINLNTITQLSGLEITANKSKTYKELINDINQFDQFKTMPLVAGYQLQFYNQDNEMITNNQQDLEKVSKIIVEITSNINDQNYQGSTKIDLTNQIIISDKDMQDYFASVTVPLAGQIPENPKTVATPSREDAVKNVTSSLKAIQKKYEFLTKLILQGLYQQKIDFTKLRNENEVYNLSEQPVVADWFKTKSKAKPAKILIFYGNNKEGYYFPIKIDII